ncbi:hypothetical protein AgCh_008953 [Apium graveolens]
MKSSEEKGGSLMKNDLWAEDRNIINLSGWLLRKCKNLLHEKIENDLTEHLSKKESPGGSMHLWTAVDRALLVGLCASWLTIAALLLLLGI